MTTKTKVTETTLEKSGISPCSYRVFGRFSHGITKRSSGGFSIRIKTGSSFNSLTGNSTESWAYFDLDKTGLVISSPRGMAKHWNKKIRITDIEEQYSKQVES